MCQNRKEKATKEKITGIKTESTGEKKKKIKEILTKYNTDKTGQSKTMKEKLSTTGRRWRKNLPTTRCQRNQTILNKNMATKKKKHYEKAEWINNMTRELEGLEEGPKAKIHTIYSKWH